MNGAMNATGGGKTPIMPALEALLQQTANVAANVSGISLARSLARSPDLGGGNLSPSSPQET